MDQRDSHKNVEIEPILRLIESVQGLIAATSRDPKYSALSSKVIANLIDAGAAMSRASQNRVIVEVPSKVMETLTQIQTETSDMQKLILQLQGMLMSQEAWKSVPSEPPKMPGYHIQPAPVYVQNRDQQNLRGDTLQSLIDSLQNLTSQRDTRPPDDPRFQAYFTK